MPEQFYAEQKEPELDPEEEEKLEIQKILFICGGVLGLCIVVLIVLSYGIKNYFMFKLAVTVDRFHSTEF